MAKNLSGWRMDLLVNFKRDSKIFEKILMDVERGTYVDKWRVSNEDIFIDEENCWYIEKNRLKGGLGDNVDVVKVYNGRLSFTLVPTRGMGIWKGEFDGCFLGWDSPVKGLVHPHYVHLEDRRGLGWLDGFNEWVVRCGLESNGAPMRTQSSTTWEMKNA